jgi:radical SAM protein with 4Fe4S-binding SPASM domain
MDVHTVIKELSPYFIRPAIVQMDITNGCNLNCGYCYNKANALSKNELSDSNFISIVKRVITELNPVGITFSGGEPLLRKRLLISSVKTIKELGDDITVTLNTNGLLLNSGTIMDLKEAGVNSININIESLNEEKHDLLRGLRGALNITKANISLFNKLWDPKVISISVVINRQNLDDLVSIASYVKENGLGSIHFIDMVPTALNDKEMLLTKEEWIKFFNIYEEIKKMGIKIIPNHALLFYNKFNNSSPNVKLPFCMAGRLSMVISADGSIVPCNYFKEPEYICGNALNDNLLDVWQKSSIMEKFRYSMDGYDTCGTCENLKSCYGGCKAFARAVSGKPFSQDPYCSIYNLNNAR